MTISAAMNAGLLRASDTTAMMPTPSRMTGMAFPAAAIAPAQPAMIAALASFERMMGFGGCGKSGDQATGFGPDLATV